MEIPATAMRTMGRVPEIVLLSGAFFARMMRDAMKNSVFKFMFLAKTQSSQSNSNT